MKKIMFQGDSITDTFRNTDTGSIHGIGHGYPFIVSSYLSAKYPGKYEYINRGISGNRLIDLYARIKEDGWNDEPYVLSVLIGVNDVGHLLDPRNNGADPRRFKNIYRMLISDTLIESPKTKLLIMEPFVLCGSGTAPTWDRYEPMVYEIAAVTREVAAEYGQVFLPIQQILSEACKEAPAEYWLADGVHPTTAGHQLIADAWVKCFEENFAD